MDNMVIECASSGARGTGRRDTTWYLPNNIKYEYLRSTEVSNRAAYGEHYMVESEKWLSIPVNRSELTRVSYVPRDQ